IMSTDRYPFREIETKWQRIWEETKQFRVHEDPSRPKFYCLEMFPYPSGRIHMGHVRVYAIGDLLARYKWMRGYNVLHPMGWDAFGLPAENAAIEHGVHPAIWTYENIDYMRAQLMRMGISYDWDREVATCDPTYYKWEQLIFIKMLERGLAYRKRSTVNWCPSCQTVLANEQVEDGHCWRCDSVVTPREIDGWFFKITDYAEELLAWCDRLPGWPERVLTMQRNWIGKSEGAEFDLRVDGQPDLSFRVFTTRPDTVFGMTYAVLAPEHPLVDRVVRDAAERETVARFRAEVSRQSEIERTAVDRPKRGLRLSASVVNPFTNTPVPLFLADYVLMGYGTGAIMAVPGEDERDWEFAEQYGLPIIETVKRPDGWTGKAYSGDGVKVNSGFLDGLSVTEAKRRATDWLVSGGIEHAVLHLLYARFYTKVLRDLGLTKIDEPFMALLSQGMVIKDGAKMSKSRGNVVSDDYVREKYGADTGRLFELFAAPPEKDLEWNDQGIEGASRFLNRLWRFVLTHLNELGGGEALSKAQVETVTALERPGGALGGGVSPHPSSTDGGRAFRRVIHETIRRVTDDIEREFHFNTAIAAIMELFNALQAYEQASPEGRGAGPDPERTALLREATETLLLLLGPFCPHVTEELWSRLGHSESLFRQRWPEADPAALQKTEVTVVVQVDGKVRGRLLVDVDAADDRVRQLALDDDRVKPWVGQRRVEKVVVVPNRLVNIVTRA